jgi:DivIVA domain-containing protein
MPLTPVDVQNVTFGKPPIGKRGYNEEEVDAFLDLVSAELTRLINENNDLHNRVDRLNERLRAATQNTGGNVRPLAAMPVQRGNQAPIGDQHAQTAKVLSMAQEIADRLTGEAKAEADRMLSQARTTAQQLLAEARTRTNDMVNEARIRSQTMLDDARTRAEILDRQAGEKAMALEREVARKHTETLAEISREKDVLEKKVDELRTFEQEYRTHLKAYLDSQLRELDDPASAKPADTTRNEPSFAAAEFDTQAAPTTTVLFRQTG